MFKNLTKLFGKLFMEHPVAPHVMVVGVVMMITFVWHTISEPERRAFEVMTNGFITAIVATPIIFLVLRQHRKLQDVTAKYERLSATDQMTGILNRQSFIERVQSIIDVNHLATSAGAFAYLDADKFKSINDQHGHAVGDRVIKLIVGSIEASVRDNDVCARLGGEEFGAFLRGASLDEAARVAERIRQRVREDALREGESFPEVSVSIGVAKHRPGETVEALMQEADRSLYAAKQAGRDSVVVELKRYRAA